MFDRRRKQTEEGNNESSAPESSSGSSEVSEQVQPKVIQKRTSRNCSRVASVDLNDTQTRRAEPSSSKYQGYATNSICNPIPLELNDLLSFSSHKLTHNFTLILERLEKHEQLLELQAEQIRNHQDAIVAAQLKNQQLEQRLGLEAEARRNDVQTVRNEVETIHQSGSEDATKLKENIEAVKKELGHTQLQFEEQFTIVRRQISDEVEEVQKMREAVAKVEDNLLTRQKVTQVKIVADSLHACQEKALKAEGLLKLIEQKVQKLEIYNEKSERLQGKKDAQLTKEIEEKIRRELKNGTFLTSKSSNGNSNNGSSMLPILGVANQTGGNDSNQKANGLPQKINNNTARDHCQSADMRQDGSGPQTLNTNKRPTPQIGHQDFIEPRMSDHQISKLVDRLKSLETTMKIVQETLKNRRQSTAQTVLGKENQNTLASSDNQLNEIKPGMVKIWAKLDTLEDRISYSEAKIEERAKAINEINMELKRINTGRLEEKISSVQAQLQVVVKDMRSKIEQKVAIQDFERHSASTEQRLTQLFELVASKSDKLQVKKALLFLESKIKEIILVISEDEEHEKEALFTKKQLKCMSCDKEVQRMLHNSTQRNWDALPNKEPAIQSLGRHGITNYGSLTKKIRKLESKDLPVLRKTPRESFLG